MVLLNYTSTITQLVPNVCIMYKVVHSSSFNIYHFNVYFPLHFTDIMVACWQTSKLLFWAYHDQHHPEQRSGDHLKVDTSIHTENISCFASKKHHPMHSWSTCSHAHIMWKYNFSFTAVYLAAANVNFLHHAFYTVVIIKPARANIQIWHRIKTSSQNSGIPESYQANNGKNTTKSIKCSRQRTTCRQIQAQIHTTSPWQLHNASRDGTVGASLRQTGCFFWLQSPTQWLVSQVRRVLYDSIGAHLGTASYQPAVPPRRP